MRSSGCLPAKNPGYRVTWVNANASVERMIKKALAGQVVGDQGKLPFE